MSSESLSEEASSSPSRRRFSRRSSVLVSRQRPSTSSHPPPLPVQSCVSTASSNCSPSCVGWSLNSQADSLAETAFGKEDGMH